MELVIYSPLNHRHNHLEKVNSYAEVEAALKKTIENLSDSEVINMQFRLEQKQRVGGKVIPSYTFGLKRGNFVQTEQDIMKLKTENHLAIGTRCTKPGKYLVVENYPRTYKRKDHANVSVATQCILEYGQPEYPIYSVGNLKRAVVNRGEALSVVFERMQNEAVAGK